MHSTPVRPRITYIMRDGGGVPGAAAAWRTRAHGVVQVNGGKLAALYIGCAAGV